MSINRSLYIGLSGMNVNSQALNVIGDNIANLNTIGYKGSRTVFQEMLGQSILGTARNSTVGGGVGLGKVEKMFSQGALLGTGVSTDLAIGGEGFFCLEGNFDGKSGQFFSRAGQYGFDGDGFLVNPNGLKLQGYTADSDGKMGTTLGSLQVNDTPFPPKATSSVDITANLKFDQEVSETPFDVESPDTTADYTTGITLYDAAGTPIQANVHFKKTADGKWDYYVVSDGANLEGGEEGTNQIISKGTLEFTAEGKLKSETPDTTGFEFQPKGGAVQALTFDFGKSIDEGGTGDGATTSYSDPSTVSKLDQDGSQAGSFQQLSIDSDGKIIGMFSNGKERVLGQVALAKIKAPSGLNDLGGGLFGASSASGAVTIGAAGTGGRGRLQAGALEQSTVDLATEFTHMILAQRGYQANSRSITTADQMIQEAVNLKR